MTRSSPSKSKRFIPFVALALLLCAPSWTARAGTTTPSSRAFGAGLSTMRMPGTYIADTSVPASPGPGATSPGALSLATTDPGPGVDTIDANVPGILSAEVLTATTSLETDRATSASSLAEVVLLAGSPAEVRASFVRAQSIVLDANGSKKWNGSAEIDGLTFGGKSIAVTGQPNQRVDMAGVATLYIDEQITSSQGGVSTLTVNGLRLLLAGGDQFTLASATSVWDKQVVPPVAFRQPGPLARPPAVFVHEIPECHDFVTGGGWFAPRFEGGPPEKVNFGFNAGYRTVDGKLLGHVNVVDHNDGTHIEGVDVDTYARLGDPQSLCRMFEGDAEMNHVSGFRYHVEVCDYGEPGRDDRFRILVYDAAGSEVYFADDSDSAKTCPADEPRCGDLDGGNIQIHKNCDASGATSASLPFDTHPQA